MSQFWKETIIAGLAGLAGGLIIGLVIRWFIKQ